MKYMRAAVLPNEATRASGNLGSLAIASTTHLNVCRARFERFVKTIAHSADEVYVVTGVHCQCILP